MQCNNLATNHILAYLINCSSSLNFYPQMPFFIMVFLQKHWEKKFFVWRRKNHVAQSISIVFALAINKHKFARYFKFRREK